MGENNWRFECYSKRNVGSEISIGGVKSDGNGRIVCIKSDGNLGTCTSEIDDDDIKNVDTCTCG